MSLSTSVVARCCSAIVFSSRVRGSISFSRRKVRDIRRCWVIESRRFCLAVLRSRALADPPTDLERRPILSLLAAEVASLSDDCIANVLYESIVHLVFKYTLHVHFV